MSTSQLFLLDSNVLMTAARHYYAFDIAPGFWSALDRKAGDGELRSIDRVYAEINRGNDELVSWVNHIFADYFFTTETPEVIQKYTEIIFWSQKQDGYSSAVKQDFARYDHADPWLVAYAFVNECAVVTLESANQATKKKIPIPIICDAFDVPWTNTFDMLRRKQIRLG
ncbi:MAG: DUF4411 family protein [Chlorobium phaeobacteroides]|uniref:PIN domain protein n=1 Tax=Chlorobium phaeobacteroides (strain BS1) TaxID=331678 RepID=B3EQ77_CHLPB|nr:DUF4411 family protein [Prosthecochloris sp.]MBC8524809.1 DUF4411 family protein [Chlorobium phaeobacteroides]MBL6956515.1 DUF4411 family protein [Chlorobium phaeobacteroides]NEX11336.1 DUF4411 domain-containing protein [Prosthecochloris sp.]